MKYKQNINVVSPAVYAWLLKECEGKPRYKEEISNSPGQVLEYVGLEGLERITCDTSISCSYCGSRNDWNTDNCINCGAPRIISR